MNKDMSKKSQDSVVIETPPSLVGQSASGKYKFEVRDENGLVCDSGNWKPNLILDCGLDKLADMPWAQTFQWAVAGTDPTPTVEKFEHTRLKVNLDLWNTCDNPEAGYVFPDGRKLECWEEEMQPIRVRATNGCREAPVLPISYDASKQVNIKNVPDNASSFRRSFGKLTEIGSTLYLRDQNLQFKVIGSCPQYLIEPLQATADVMAVSGFCSTLGALAAPSGSPTDLLTEVRNPTTGVFSKVYNMDSDPSVNFIDRGLVATHKERIGQGYIGLGGNILPVGDPSVPLFDNTGAQDPNSGIRVSYPQGRSGKIRIKVNVKNDTTGIKEGDLELIDQGDGYGWSAECPDGKPIVTFEAPTYNAHWGPWTHDDDNNWNKSMYEGAYSQRYGGILRSAGRHGPVRYGHQFEVEHMSSAWRGTMWSTHGHLGNLTKDVYEHIWGDGTEPMTSSSHPMGYGTNGAGADAIANVPAKWIPTSIPGAAMPYNEYQLLMSQMLLMHFLPFHGPTGQHWYNSPAKIDWKDSQDFTYVAGEDKLAYFMKPSWTAANPGDWKNGYPTYHASTQNVAVAGVKTTIAACDNSDGFKITTASGDKFSDPNDNVMNLIDAQWDSAAGIINAIKQDELCLADLYRINDKVGATDVYIPIASIKNLGFRHEAYYNNPDGPVTQPGGAGGELQKIIESWAANNGAFSVGHFEADTLYEFKCRRTGHDSYFLHQSNTSTYLGFGGEANLFHRMTGTAQIQLETAFSILTDSTGVATWFVVNPGAWIAQLISDQTEAQTNDRHRETLEDIATDMDRGRLYAGNFFQASNPRMITPGLPQRRPATATATITDCKIDEIAIIDQGRGYSIGDTPSVVMTGPTTRRAEVTATLDPDNGWITGFTVVDPGEGYSCTNPVKIGFPRPPIQEIRAWDLIVKPSMTYESINNDYTYKRLEAGIADDIFQEQNCDIYHTEQTYLGQGKSHFDPGTVTNGPLDGGYSSQPNVRCGPCHYVEYDGPFNTTQYVGGDKTQPGSYTISEDDLFDGNIGTGNCVPVEKVYHNQYKTHGWYLTGTDPETNSMYCGTDFLTSGNQVIMTRTYDFYMELQPVTYTEVGFKESPAARELFSRIVFDDPIRLRAGQYLRLSYQLLLTMEPGPTARYREVPSEGTWVNGRREWIDANTGDRTVTPVLTGYECIQGNGIAVVGSDGVATPYDITGVANEPYAPGSYFLGPQYGYVNRWKNGDTRLSYPTREYRKDINNPWIHGGDQHNPPDWAIRHFRSPTQNYMPRNFRSYLEWPVFKQQIPKGWSGTNWTPGTNTKPWHTVQFPPGPESTLERDAFSHWYVPYFANGEQTGEGHLTWMNFVLNKNGPEGRWDFHVTKPYLREVYPHLMRDTLMINGLNQTLPLPWITKYENGHKLGSDGINQWFSGRGVYPCPVIEYDGQPGALHDPTTISTVNKNPLSFTGGMGLITRATYLAKNPYTGTVFTMLLPHNNGSSGQCWNILKYHQRACGFPGTGDVYWLDWNSPSQGTGAQCGGSGSIGHWCWHAHVPVIKEHHVFGPFDLDRRQKDIQSMHNRWNLDNIYPTQNSYGGGFTTMESWKTWTHTPLINVISNWRGGTPVSVPGIVNPMAVAPDTVGNWAGSEVIPVAGTSAFITTSNREFAIVGQYQNLSHTLYGAVSGAGGDPEHDFEKNAPKSSAALADGLITNAERVATSGNGFVRSFEVPTYLNDYTRGDHRREKYAEWETSFANLTGVCAIGTGPTSTTLMPIEMSDAARFNTYVFKFGTPTGFANRFDNLTTFKLKTTFLHTWYRDLT